MKKITSIEHAMDVLSQEVNYDLLKKSITELMPGADVEPLIAHYQLTKIVEANNKLNGDWKADWGNWDQRKYFVWKETKADETKPSGFGFSNSGTYNWVTNTHVGARLSVATQEQALYIGKDFEHLFEIAWFIIPNSTEAK